MRYRASNDQSSWEVILAFGGRWLIALGVIVLMAWLMASCNPSIGLYDMDCPRLCSSQCYDCKACSQAKHHNCDNDRCDHGYGR